MYHLYHTDAFVLCSTSSGEGSKLITLFTRELGFLTASAQSVREERSKLRYGLQDFSYSDMTFVRGREFWRITNATLKENIFKTLSGSEEATRMVGRIFALLRRLLTGEEKNEPLFIAVLEGFNFLKASSVPPFLKEGGRVLETEDFKIPPALEGVLPSGRGESNIAGVEIVLVLRILYLLGYLAPRNEFNPFLSHSALWDESIISNALLFRALAVAEINNSLRETQL